MRFTSRGARGCMGRVGMDELECAAADRCDDLDGPSENGRADACTRRRERLSADLPHAATLLQCVCAARGTRNRQRTAQRPLGRGSESLKASNDSQNTNDAASESESSVGEMLLAHAAAAAQAAAWQWSLVEQTVDWTTSLADLFD